MYSPVLLIGLNAMGAEQPVTTIGCLLASPMALESAMEHFLRLTKRKLFSTFQHLPYITIHFIVCLLDCFVRRLLGSFFMNFPKVLNRCISQPRHEMIVQIASKDVEREFGEIVLLACFRTIDKIQPAESLYCCVKKEI